MEPTSMQTGNPGVLLRGATAGIRRLVQRGSRRSGGGTNLAGMAGMVQVTEAGMMSSRAGMPREAHLEKQRRRTATRQRLQAFQLKSDRREAEQGGMARTATRQRLQAFQLKSDRREAEQGGMARTATRQRLQAFQLKSDRREAEQGGMARTAAVWPTSPASGKGASPSSEPNYSGC
ncbi:unnamed protein product [Effrenium voratum]|uniref:Uncharacterized protein n=1 Tax=Effrenium voratum TaxID=2562239 RepID=A0AA36J2N6_9DINO|nr:unnamed protein product [Effrenium voratum]